MKRGPQMALAVAGGYLLGRTKKMKLAIMLGGMAAGRRVGSPTELLTQGAGLIGGSPEVSKLADQVRADLVEAGKGAVAAAAARQIDSVSDRLHTRSEALRGASSGSDDGSAASESTSAESTSRGAASRSAGSSARSGTSRKAATGKATGSAARGGSGGRNQGQRKQTTGRSPRRGESDG
ncbi:MAG: hypothetical protein GEV09_23665 [Pseudonocardiaceae bacterium]|nr:hypothetical protein [Pseudonocardiaceae bacterium]